MEGNQRKNWSDNVEEHVKTFNFSGVDAWGRKMTGAGLPGRMAYPMLFPYYIRCC